MRDFARGRDDAMVLVCASGARHDAPAHPPGIGSEQDVVLVRQRARQIAALLGFGVQDQVRIATAVSEVARGAAKHGDGGRATFSADPGDDRQVLE
jgi:hypothetical protein